MEKIQIGIIEDDQYFLTTLREFFNSQQDMVCVLSAGTVEDFYKRLKPYHHIDVLLLDVQLPGKNGDEAIPGIKSKLPSIDIVMFTVYDSDDRLFKCLLHGASGYLLKSTPLNEIREQIQLIKKGGAAISPLMAKKLINYFNPGDAPKRTVGLGEKDMKILKLLAEGWSYQHIADTMNMKVDGIRYYVKKIYKQLDVNSRHEATRKYRDLTDE